MADFAREPMFLNFAVLTVSDTRTLKTDRSGDTLITKIRASGHTVAERVLVTDAVEHIEAALGRLLVNPDVDVVISTGGTGITGRDVTPEAFRRVLQKELPGFGEFFRMLSFQKIGLAAMQSRALAGIANGKYLFALPGSPGAVADAWDDILAHQFDPGATQCNLAELLPRVREQ